MQNLIGNSVKYGRPGVPPEIRISCERAKACWKFAVSDNGSGFSSEDAERIFGLFKRLHGYEIAGTGIGLAICRRIIEQHGGVIRAEGQPGEGATFSFTLPAADAAEAACYHPDSAGELVSEHA
jgi:signal transduction histidine kinase